MSSLLPQQRTNAHLVHFIFFNLLKKVIFKNSILKKSKILVNSILESVGGP